MNLMNNVLYKSEISKLASELKNYKGSILVTGATGMIGSCILDVLLKINMDQSETFKIYAVGRNRKRFEERFEYAYNDIIFIEQDICDELKVNDDIDYIIHTASNADPLSYVNNLVETMLINVEGTKNILNYGKKHKGTRILFTSSFEVYGKCDHDEYVEEDFGQIDQNSIRSGYPESKRVAELLCRSYAKQYGVNVVVARLSSVYGPTMKENDSKAHAQFIKNGLRHENIVMKSEGFQRRTYCYIMDAVSGIFKVLFCGHNGEVYNVANANSVASIAEFAKLVASMSGSAVIIQTPDEIEKSGYSCPQNCILVTNKLAKLNWKGNYSLHEGIENTLKILGESNEE